MNDKQVFKKVYSKVSAEGIVKSLICGFIIGFSVSFIIALTTYLLIVDGLWYSVGIGVAATAVSTLLFYFKKFRPTAKKIAERIDRLGLDERLITMMELEKDESYIAMRQREDAKEKLAAVSSESVKLRVSKAPIIAVAIIAVFSITMVTLSTLSANGMVDWPFGPDDNDPSNYCNVTYAAIEYEYNYPLMKRNLPHDEGTGGFIAGVQEQPVKYGDYGSLVVAVADDVYLFDAWAVYGLNKMTGKYEWMYDSTDPERTEFIPKEFKELGIKDFKVYAVFKLLIEQSQKTGPDGERPPDITNKDKPIDPNETEAIDGVTKGPPDIDPNGGYFDKTVDKVIDDIHYRELYDELYYKLGLSDLDGGEFTPELRGIIEAYLDMLK